MAKSALGPIPDDHFEFDMDFDFDAAAKKYSTMQLLKLSLLPTRERVRAFQDFNEADHPRDSDGKFTEAGDSDAEGGDDKAIESTSVAAETSAQAPETTSLNPEVTEVGGDEWNQETAVRLEKEYVEAKPKVEAILNDAVGAKLSGYDVSDWGGLSEQHQDEAYDIYKTKHFDSFYDSEMESWIENSREDDARDKVAYDFNGGNDQEWAADAVANIREELKAEGTEIVLNDVAILNALNITHDTGYGNPKSGTTTNLDIPNETIPHPVQERILGEIRKEFDKQAEGVAEDMNPPPYLENSAYESMEENWSQMPDDMKLQWMKENTNILEDIRDEYGGVMTIDSLPAKFDPLDRSDGGGYDYPKTQLIAKHISTQRAAELVVERVYKGEGKPEAIIGSVRAADDRIWEAWKGSSTSVFGQMLQVATAEELGGRLYTGHKSFRTPESLKGEADQTFRDIGGFEGIKAMVRAKWETTQLLLEKAGHDTVTLYRAVVIPELTKPASFDVQIFNKQGNEIAKYEVQAGANSAKDLMNYKEQAEAAGHTFKATEIPETTVEKIEVPLPGTTSYEVTGVNNNLGTTEVKLPFATKEEAENMVKEMIKTGDGKSSWAIKETISQDKLRYEKLPDVDIRRNGASSTTLKPSVANGWNGDGRTVLRIEVPRTAVLSVPAYGVNVHGEKEVVVTGTAWKQWDAWKSRAPDFETVPMKKAA